MKPSAEPEGDWRALLEWILRSRGFDGRQYKPNYLRRRVAVRMRAVGASDHGSYLAVLKADPEEGEALFKRLTIHVTEFFRDPEVYQALEDRILPSLDDAAREPGTAVSCRAWSAGCSTGEEPYSMALCLAEWAAKGIGRDYAVLATDIDETSVETAREGDYPLAALNRLEPRRARRWFVREDGRVGPVPELKERIEFRVHDLLGAWSRDLKDLDLVFCRNLLIYLGRDQQQVLYRRFHGALRTGGFLVLGKTEALLGKARKLYECIDIPNRVYRSLPMEEGGVDG